MASVTLVEAAKLHENPLVQGVIESIVTVNPIYSVLPFDQILGNAINYNVEKALGGVDFVGVGGIQSGESTPDNTISSTAKTPATFTQKTSVIKPMIGDAYVDHFIQSSMTNPNDQKAVQVASKAKAIGREFQDVMVNGNSSTNPLAFDGLSLLVPASQTIATTGGGTTMSFEMLDELISMVKAKDGQVDFFMMPDFLLRKYFSLLRGLGGASITETANLPDGRTVPAYRNVPIFRNDYITVAGSMASIYAGTFDDGSRKVGISGLTTTNNSGIFVSELGEAEDTNDTITRIRFYCGFAAFTELGVARAQYVKSS